MSEFREILLKLCNREDLTRDEAREAFARIMSGEASEAQIGGLLVGLAAKGTTVEELVGATTAMREKALRIAAPVSGSGDQTQSANEASQRGDSAGGGEGKENPDAAGNVVLDTCGTGGDVRGTFNISTAAALIAAASGVRVVKHGNRSASSKCGSADVLEKLGVHLEASPRQLERSLIQANICFAFARSHHPAMKYVAQARGALGIPTIFNLLGPLTNPAGARHQVIGVFAPELTDRLAAVLRELGSQRAWVVHADDGLDEISTLGPTRISELQNGRVRTWRLDPATLGLAYGRLSDLSVSNVDEGAEAIRQLLAGQKGPRRDIAMLNAAAAMVVAGRVDSLPRGLALGAEALDSGQAQRTLEALVRYSNS